MLESIRHTTAFLEAKGIVNPGIGIVLGTGLGKLVDHIDVAQTVEYAEIPDFPVSTVESHSGRLIYGKMHNKTVVAMMGRFHYYEGYTMQQITFPVRVMKMLGIKHLLLSNAAGSMNPRFKKGSIMLIDDHINLQPDNPLRGRNTDELGPRFPDMSRPYSPVLNAMLEKIAERNHILLHKGTYLSVSGPNLETRAEYRMFRNFADAVGMSTVPEVIVANHMSLPCAALSVLTDECDPDDLKPARIEDILETAGRAEVNLNLLVSELIKEL